MVGKSYAIVPEGQQPAGGGPPMPSKPPSLLHEMVMAMIRQIFRDEIARVLPLMGTITSASGVNVLVRRDSDSADLLIPHVAGRRWPTGTRVVIIPGDRGEYVVIGGMTTGIGAAENVIGVNDVLDGNITLAKVGPDVITRFVAVEGAATSALAQIGTDRGTAAASTGLWAGIHSSGEAANTAQSLASSAFNRATVAQSGADVASLGVVNILNGTSTVPVKANTVGAAQIADGSVGRAELAAGAVGNSNLSSVIQGKLNALCTNAFGSANCGIPGE